MSPAYKSRIREPKRVAEGFLVHPEESPTPLLKMLFAGLGLYGVFRLCAAAWPRLAAAWPRLMADIAENTFRVEPFHIPFLFAGALISFIGFLIVVALILWLFSAVISVLCFWAPTLTLANHPLRMGETVVLHFRSRLRFGRTRQPSVISGRLRCYEQVTVKSGSTTSTETADIYVVYLTRISIPPGTSHFYYEAPFMVPRHGPPSIELVDNRVTWQLEISLQVPGLPLQNFNYPVLVLPEALP